MYMYQLSILIPSKYPVKLERLLNNLKDTLANFNDVEIVICKDGDGPTIREGNIVECYSPPTKYRSTFHEKPALEATGRWLMMANDDLIFETPNWDLMIPYHVFPDDLGMFYFKDDTFNENFACHPVFSRKVLDLDRTILSPLYQITKCDNTVWDIHPPHRRKYVQEIQLKHFHEGYGPEWKRVYEEDNTEYFKHIDARSRVRNKILELINENPKVMVGVCTGEMARRADFYDHYQMIEKPKDTICVFLHGQSIANNRNKIVEQVLAYDCTHLMFLDDDVICRPDIIYQLLKHDKDIVMALQPRRNFPHNPLVFDRELPGDNYRVYQLKNEEKGLIPVVSGGLGAVLIKTSVFKAMEMPWFRFGEFQKDQMSEDTGFYKRARQHYFDVFCDLDCRVGHQGNMIVRYYYVNGMWTVNYDSGGEGSIGFPVPNIPVLVKEEV